MVVSKYSYLAFIVLLLGYVLSVFHRLTIAIMADCLMEDMGINAIQLGVLTAVYFYPYAFMQFPVGILADRIGPRRLISSMLLITALASVAFSMAENFYLAVAARLIIGLSVSFVFVPTQKFIATDFPPSMFATLAGFLPFAGMLGGISASLPLAFMVDVFGWRMVFLLLGAATAVLALGVWLLVSDHPKHNSNPLNTSGQEKGLTGDTEAPGLFASMKMVIGEWGLWPISIRNFLNYGAIMAFQSLWAGPYLMIIIGVDRITAGYLLMLMSVGQLITAPLSGYFSDRFFKSRKIPGIIAGYGLVLFWIPFAFWGQHLTPFQIGALFFFNGFWNGFATGAGLAQIKELYPLSVSGSAMGLGNLFTMAGPCFFPIFISTVMAGNPGVASEISMESFTVGFRYLLAASILAAIAITFSKETLHRTGDKKQIGL